MVAIFSFNWWYEHVATVIPILREENHGPFIQLYCHRKTAGTRRSFYFCAPEQGAWRVSAIVSIGIEKLTYLTNIGVQLWRFPTVLNLPSSRRCIRNWGHGSRLLSAQTTGFAPPRATAT